MKIIKLAKKVKKELLNNLNAAAKGKKIKEKYFTTWIGDIAEHIHYYDTIIKGDFNTARRLHENMDTSSRERIDDRIWDELDKILTDEDLED